MYFTITNIFLQPFTLLLLIMGLLIANLWRKRRERRGRLLPLTIAFAALLLTTIPAVIYPALGSLEWRFPPLLRRPDGAEAIVVLGGGMVPADAIRPRAELTEATVFRCLHAAEIYHQGKPCPVIVTGGTVDPSSSVPPNAPYMRDLLVHLGVSPADVVIEDRARTTYENAVETRRILERLQVRKILLVTEAIHMFRSLQCFREQGIEVVPAACHYRATEFRYKLGDFLPSPGAAGNGGAVIHEWLGMVWYWLKGRL
jgi:uncharacterized SAM-binding protein YcdF (DUF218 family)